MKKLIIIIGMLFLLSGCDVQYNLEYTNNIFKENVSVNGCENDNTNNIQFINLLNVYNQDGIYVNYQNNDAGDVEIIGDKYNTSLFNNGCGINFNYNFNTVDDYLNSSFVNSLYKNFVVNDSGIYMNSTTDIYVLYPILNNITIKFATDKKISDHNADKVESNVYFWNINKKNYKDKKIFVKFDNIIEQEKEYVDNGYLTDNFIKYFLFVLLIIILIIILMIYNKIKNSNKKW